MTPVITVPILEIVRLVQQASVAVGTSKLHAVPHCTVLLLAQVSTGGLVFTTVTIWLHVLLLPQASVISHVCLMNCGQTPLVTMPVDVMSRLVTRPVVVKISLVQQVEAVG
jgi:hypothetical protein